MSLPGVDINVQDGNLSLQPSSAEKTLIYIGVSPLGTDNTLAFYGDIAALQAALDTGEVVEAAAYGLSVSGGPVGVLKLPANTRGGLSSVTHVGTGSNTITANAAPHKAITIAITTSGALGTGAFTYTVGSEATSQPVTLPTGGTYLVPGTYCTLTFPVHTYAAGESYSISTVGVVTYTTGGSGTDASVTQASSPIDWYNPLITITTSGALGAAQFTYSLDGTEGNTSAAIVVPSGAKYAIPDSGIYITFGGSMTLNDYYYFTSAGPTYSNSDLTTALTELETTYLSASYSMAAVIGNLVTGSGWVTQCATLETAAGVLFDAGLYMRFFNGAPTTGTITGSAGSVVVNSQSTDTVLATSRLSVSAPHVSAAAGDVLLTSPITGLSQRRNASWVVAARASAVEASQNVGYVGLGGVSGVTALYRNEQVTPVLDAIGFDTMRTFPGSVSAGTGLPGFYITDGHTMSATTSDYYPLTNARVMDRGCTIAKSTALQYVQSRVPTTTRNGNLGVITEKKAQIIEGTMRGALLTGLVNTEPQDAVAANATVNRTHNILSDGNLIIAVAIQPFAYARTITVNIGMAVSA